MAQQQICYGSVANYAVDYSENLGKGSVGSKYHWEVLEAGFKGIISNNAPDATNDVMINWSATPPGFYNLIVKETDSYGCTGLSQTLKVEILPLPEASLSNSFVCINPLNQEVVRKAVLDSKLSGSNYSFNWQLNTIKQGGDTSSIEVATVGTYTLEIINKNTGCKNTAEAIVALSSTAVATIKVDHFFQDNQTILVSVVNGIGDYEFSIDGINFQDSPSFPVSKGGLYSVIIRDKNGCSDEILKAHIVTYPKFFTPNGDGYNDVWKIEGLLSEMNPILSIFDRYGKLLKVFYGNNYDGWDGTFNAITAPSTDYWFTIEYRTPEGTSAIFKSHFALKR